MYNKGLMQGILLCVVLLIALNVAKVGGDSFDHAYLQRCSTWKNCDAVAIQQFKEQGCTIRGDINGNQWGECK